MKIQFFCLALSPIQHGLHLLYSAWGSMFWKEGKKVSICPKEQNRVFFTPKVTRHGFCFSSLLYEGGRKLCDHTRPSGLKFFYSLWFVTVTQDAPTAYPPGLRALSKALLILLKGPSGQGTNSVKCECWLTRLSPLQLQAMGRTFPKWSYLHRWEASLSLHKREDVC